jgi:hypothetical protein
MRYTKQNAFDQLEKCLYDVDCGDRRELSDKQIEEIRPLIKSVINNSGANYLAHFYTAHGLIIHLSVTRGENNEVRNSARLHLDDIKALADSGLLRWVEGDGESTSIAIKQFEKGY